MSVAAAERRRPPLLSRPFLLFGTAQTVSQLGSVMTQVALSLHVLHLTRSAALFANVLAVALSVQLVLYPFAGVYVDRIPRKVFLIGLDAFRGTVLLAAFALYTAAGSFRMEHVYVLVVFLAVGDAFFRPASNSMVPFLFEPRDYVQGNAATAWLVQVVAILAPPLAALTFGRFGLGAVLLLDAVTFFVSASCVAFITFRPIELPPRAPFFREMREGLAVLVSSRDLVLPTCAVAASRMLLEPWFVLGIPFLLIHTLGAPDSSVGLTQSFMVVGALASPLLVVFLKRRTTELNALRLSRGGKILAFLLLLALGFAGFREALQASVPLATAHAASVYFLAMFFNAAGFAFLSSYYQHLVPAHLLGRFAATRFGLFAVAEALGLKVYGHLLDHSPLMFALLLAVAGSLVELTCLLFVREPREAAA